MTPGAPSGDGPPAPAPSLASQVARLLHQRMERGEGILILDQLSRRDVGAAVKEGRRRGSVHAGASEDPVDAITSRGTTPVDPPPGRSLPELQGERPARPVAGTVVPPSSPASPGSAPLSGAAADPLPMVLPSDLAQVRELALGCTRCRLSETRTQVVFSDGVPDPRVLILGEAPGQNEDETGLPFVGAAGRLLDLLLASVGISRKENAYICNVLKCRPPGNRNPLPDEIACCTPWLKSQLSLVRPEVILAVGTFAAQWVTGEERPLGKLRGSVYSYEGTPVVVTYHPAALLRNSGWTRATWDDLQLLRSVMAGP